MMHAYRLQWDHDDRGDGHWDGPEWKNADWPIAFQDTDRFCCCLDRLIATMDRADDQIQTAEHVIRQIERAICENIHSMPFNSRRPAEALVQPIDFGALCSTIG